MSVSAVYRIFSGRISGGGRKDYLRAPEVGRGGICEAVRDRRKKRMNILILSCGTRNKIVQYFRNSLGNGVSLKLGVF